MSTAEKESSTTTPDSASLKGPPPPAPPAGPPPPPDGGLNAWLQVLGGFFLNFNSWGLINAFGIFQTYYTHTLLPTHSASSISWIGSLQAFLMLIVGVLCGRALDAGHFYANTLTGVFLVVFGNMMTSICKEYWHFILAQGVITGIGCGAVFIPSVTIVGTYFSSKRSLALGTAAVGSCFGGIVYPILLRELIPRVGFGWAVRTMSFLMLATLSVPLLVMRPRLPPRKSGPLVDLDALKDPAYALFLLSVVFIFIGLYVPFFYVEYYALGLNMDLSLAFYTLVIMSAASIPGRLLPPFIADKIGNLNIMAPSAFISGLLVLAWIAATSQPSLFVIIVLFGCVSGSIQAVLPATVVFLCPDLSKVGTRIGMTLFCAGLGLLIGAPIAGRILEGNGEEKDFRGLLGFAGGSVVVGSVGLGMVRWVKVGLGLGKA